MTELKLGYYWVRTKPPVVHLYIAYWTGEGFIVPGSSTRFRPEQFAWIGPCITDQLQSVVAALETPTYGDDDAFHDNLFDAIDPIREFLKNALH